MDILSKTLKWFDHNRYTAILLLCFVAVVGGVFGTVGCQSSTLSFSGDEKVTRHEFTIEANQANADFDKHAVELQAAIEKHNADVNAFNARVNLGLDDLQQQDEIRQQVLTSLSVVATDVAAGAFNPASLILPGVGALGLALGIGASADNRRKDKVITQIKAAQTIGPRASAPAVG